MSEASVAKDVETFPAPEIDPAVAQRTIPWASDLPHQPRNKWEREYQAFLRLRPALLETHRNLFVAVHEGQAVESGPELFAVLRQAQARFGRVPMYVDQVTESRCVERIPSLGRMQGEMARDPIQVHPVSKPAGPLRSCDHPLPGDQ